MLAQRLDFDPFLSGDRTIGRVGGHRDPFLAQPLGLTEPEEVDLNSFLRPLTDKPFLELNWS